MKRKILNGLLALVLVLSFSLVTVTPALAASSDATLSSLTVSSGTLTPAFASGTTSYTDSVAYNVDSITVTPTAADINATVGVTPSQPSSLSVGANPISVLVTAQDKTPTKTYTVTVTRAGLAPVALGSASAFAVLAGSTVTNTGNTTVTGDLGLSPGTSVTGSPLAIVNGTQHVTDDIAAQAQKDLSTAYIDAAGRTPVITVTGDTLAGLNLTPGIYHGGALSLTTTLTLTGDANAVWIFQADSTLTTASSSQVSLINGARAANVYWVVGSSATLGAVGGVASHFEGTILAHDSITLNTGVVIVGRALAQTAAVTLNANTIAIAPTISSFTPTSGVTTTSVVITGTNLSGASGATAVAFGGTAAASYVVNSSTQITAVVAGGATGTISVTTPGGTATSSGTFTFIAAPTITSFAPTSAGTGTSVIITGTNLTGATIVTFGGTAATSFTVDLATQITAVVAGGTTGAVLVTTPGGTATKSGFTFPTLTLIAPTSFALGTGGALVLGVNTGSSATPGSVVTNGAAWTLSVTDTTSDFMKITSGGVVGTAFANPIQVGMTSGTLTTIGLYSAQLIAHTGSGSGYYGNIGTFNIPLYASQTVVGTDLPGAYRITLTYTATPGP